MSESIPSILLYGVEKIFDRLDTAEFHALDGDILDLQVLLHNELSFQSMDMASQVYVHSKEVEFLSSDIGRDLIEGEYFLINGVKYYYRASLANDGITQRVGVNEHKD